MARSAELKLFFNFRSPYCYLASKTLFSLVDDYQVELLWRPLGGWDGRSPPERAKVKVPLTRQDVARWARRMNIPCIPPPITTDPTPAGLVSLLAEEKGCLRDYVLETTHAEWGQGRDIGQRDILCAAAARAGLAAAEVAAALEDPARRQALEDNWREAQSLGVIGVPSFVIGEQIFWGNDRIDFAREHLREAGLARA